MNINISRLIDKYIGPIICVFLLWFKIACSLFRKREILLKRKDVKRIFVIKFFGAGTILLLSPAMRKLKEEYPDALVTLLTLYENKEIANMLPGYDKIICVRMNNPFTLLVDFIKAIALIRKKRYEIIMDMEFLTNFSALATLLVTIFTSRNISVGFNSPMKWRNKVHDINISFDHSRHITKIFEKVARSLTGKESDFSFKPEKDSLIKNMDIQLADKLFASKNSSKDPRFIICININAGILCLNRRWPKEYFAIITNELAKKSNVSIALIGSKADAFYVQEFKKMLLPSENIIDVSAKTSLSELIGLFKRTGLLITNDSGPMHIASVLGLDMITFFGPETPRLYGPLANNQHVFYEDLYCSPCINIYNSKMSACRDNICLKNIKPQEALKLVEKKLKS